MAPQVINETLNASLPQINALQLTTGQVTDWRLKKAVYLLTSGVAARQTFMSVDGVKIIERYVNHVHDISRELVHCCVYICHIYVDKSIIMIMALAT